MMVLLRTALDYHRRGWCIIPIVAGTKKPPKGLRWKQYQAERPHEATVRQWFSDGDRRGVAVILGEVSGGLVCRDFDQMTSYARWAAEYHDLAQALPTVETGRPGRHVYGIADVGRIRALSKTGGAILELDDGEMRGAGYCLLPPSPHPNGTRYNWVNPLEAKVPAVDLDSSGLLSCNREDRENRGGRRDQRTLRGWCLVSQDSLLQQRVEQAIIRTLPAGGRQRHRLLFELARELKAVPGLTDAPATELKPYVREWHRRALPHIRTKPFEESWFDFAEAWEKVKYPKGEEPIAMVFAEVVEADLPEVAQQYEQQQLRSLVALCRELQRACGMGPFFLSTRTAGQLLGVHYATASRWLRGLRHDGILKLVSPGSREEGRASRYRYLAPL